MDGRGSVQGHRLDDAALHPVDQVRAAAGFDDVSSQGHGHGPAIAMGPAHVIAHTTEVVPSQLVRQGLDPIADTGIRRHRTAQVFHKDLGRSRLQLVGCQSLQVEWFHP